MSDTIVRGATTAVPVTVVIAARNESANIAACIDSVRWANEILVADHDSTDDTARCATLAGATVFTASDDVTIGAVRNSAIARAKNRWVLVVDADERGTPELERAVRGVLSQPVSVAYRIPRKNFFMGDEIRHGGWDADRPVRLFDSALRYDDSRVHEHVVTTGEPGLIGAALLHYPYASLDVYFEKFVRYSRWWAEDQFRRGRRTSAAAVVFKPPARFVSMLVLRMGFLDGARGVILASLAAASVCAKYARLWAMQCGF
ncbi:MAG: glycosyltransferase family 2 protein [Gemmatimonadota bacterium]|nr:glycosyltransferase family 2 protein [Gemmatimonadota bacterium]